MSVFTPLLNSWTAELNSHSHIFEQLSSWKWSENPNIKSWNQTRKPPDEIVIRKHLIRSKRELERRDCVHDYFKTTTQPINHCESFLSSQTPIHGLICSDFHNLCFSSSSPKNAARQTEKSWFLLDKRNSVRDALAIGLNIYCNKWNTVTFGADGSALKMLLELTKQHAKLKQGAQCRKPPQGVQDWAIRKTILKLFKCCFLTLSSDRTRPRWRGVGGKLSGSSSVWQLLSQSGYEWGGSHF